MLREEHSIVRILRVTEWIGTKWIVASSTDSDLEAFSHNPAGGSFPAMAFPPAGNTRDLK